jgi:hypothetical protein
VILNKSPYGNYEMISALVSVHNQGNRDVTSLFWVDLYAAPTSTFTRTAETKVQHIAIGSLTAGSTVTFTMYIADGFPDLGVGYTLQAMADSWDRITESDEDNNLSVSRTITLTKSNPTPEPTPEIPLGKVGEVWGAVTAGGSLRHNARVWVNSYPPVPEVFSDANGYYDLGSVPVGTWIVSGEWWQLGAYYFGTATVVVTENGSIERNLSLDLFDVYGQ